MKLTINYDQYTECPAEYSDWNIFSFSTKHINFKNPNEFFPLSAGLKRKIKCKTAFILSCYQHGSCQWGLQGETIQCRFDTAQIAGILIWNGLAKDLSRNIEKRVESARSFLKVYTDWWNGETYCFNIENEKGEIIDSCVGIIGVDNLINSLKEHPELFAKDIVLELDGNAKEIFKCII